MFEFQENSTLSYQLGYITGTSITVSGVSWVTGRVFLIIGGALESKCSGGFRETGLKYYGKKGANGLKTIGNILALPVDTVLVGSCIGVRMCVNSLVKKNITIPDEEEIEETQLSDISFSPVSDMRIQFNGFVREMPKNLRSLFLGSGTQAYEDLYQKYLSLDFDGRCDMGDFLQENAQKINSADMILLLFDGYKAGFKKPGLEGGATTEEKYDTDPDDEYNNPNLQVIIEYSSKDIREALDQGMMNPSQAKFLSFAQKKPGK